LQDGDVVELGNVIVEPDLQRTSDSQITVADLTGVAVQDIQISKAVYEVLTAGTRGPTPSGAVAREEIP
jgi:ornithine cyclodeaminase